jgi:hypothetical protein
MLILGKEAEEDLKSAMNGMSASITLGMTFPSETGRRLDAIDNRPDHYAHVFRTIRRALCEYFPYAIYFFEIDTGIRIPAVPHQRRNPAHWQTGE